MKENIRMWKLADQISEELLRNGITVHRLNAVTTNSIYLKLDYGVLNSIRISDHPGKKHLKYRYNVLTSIDRFKLTNENGFARMYYPVTWDMIDNMIRCILKTKEIKMTGLTEEKYQEYMQERHDKSRHSKGFWKSAYKVL